MFPALRAVFFVGVALLPTFSLAGDHLPETVTVSGFLQDITQAGIPHATVTIRSAGTDKPVATFDTGPAGTFQFYFLRDSAPGPYTVRFEASGFIPLSVSWPPAHPVVAMQVDPMPKELRFPPEYADLEDCRSCYAPDLALPIKTTLCEIAKDPKRFNGKVVRIRVGMLSPSADTPTRLYDHRCSANITLETGAPSLLRNVEYLRLLRSLTTNDGATEAVVTGTFERTSLEPNLHTIYDRVDLRSASDVVSKSIVRPVNRKAR